MADVLQISHWTMEKCCLKELLVEREVVGSRHCQGGLCIQSHDDDDDDFFVPILALVGDSK